MASFCESVAVTHAEVEICNFSYNVSICTICGSHMCCHMCGHMLKQTVIRQPHSIMLSAIGSCLCM